MVPTGVYMIVDKNKKKKRKDEVGPINLLQQQKHQAPSCCSKVQYSV